MSLHVTCGLGFSQAKILDTRINWRSSEKKFLRPFFLKNTCGCVLCPWPWPWAFLSLASRVSVLGRAVLGLGFFCVLGLEPCVLDSTSGGHNKELIKRIEVTKAITLQDYHVTKNLFWNHRLLRQRRCYQSYATIDKNVTKIFLFHHFQFLLAFFAYNITEQ